MSINKDFQGAVEFIGDHLLETRLAQAQKDVEDLTAEKARRAQFTPAMRLADRLHALLHGRLDCDYFYSKWPTTATGCRAEFYSKAQSIVNSFDAAEIEVFFRILERKEL